MAFFSSKPKGDGKRQMSVELSVTMKEEGGSFVAYSPDLDLSTCGSTKEEALDMFNEAVRVFFNDIVRSGTAHAVLTELGWTPANAANSNQTWTPPRISQESVQVEIPVMA